MRHLVLSCIVFLLALCVVGAQEADEGFVPLFNGNDLTGWHAMGAKSWKAENAALVCTGEGGGWIRTAEQYEDFVLRLEFKR